MQSYLWADYLLLFDLKLEVTKGLAEDLYLWYCLGSLLPMKGKDPHKT